MNSVFVRFLIATLIMVLLAGFFATHSSASTVENTKVVDEVVYIHSGSMVVVHINDWPEIVGDSISVLIRGIDVPSINASCEKEKALGWASRRYLAEILRSADEVVISKYSRGKYFNLEADIFADGLNVSQRIGSI